MLTRIEIDGFKTFEHFALDLQPFSAIVGPNASGKSNLFDAIRFLSLLAQHDVRTAMQGVRGRPEELFRRTQEGSAERMSFAVEVLLGVSGTDAFGSHYRVNAQRLRYEVELTLKTDANGTGKGVFVSRESCTPIAKKLDKAAFLRSLPISYSGRKTAFISMREADSGIGPALEIRQDGPAVDSGASKRGRPVTLPATEASRTALSTIASAEFPHLYAVRELFVSTRFLEINPQAARQPNDRFEDKRLRPDASNLSAVLAHLRDETRRDDRPEGVINDISADLASLIPSVRAVEIMSDANVKDYSFDIAMSDEMRFSARVISDGTMRLLALLAMLDDPQRRGVLCFEEPENGVHQGRIEALISLLRDSVSMSLQPDAEPFFQVLINTHSPAVLQVLKAGEAIAADMVRVIEAETGRSVLKTRMRVLFERAESTFDPERHLTHAEATYLLDSPGIAA